MNTMMDGSDQTERKRQYQHLAFEHFISRFRPSDPGERYDFEAALIRLVQDVYQEAQAPMLKALTDAAMLGMGRVTFPPAGAQPLQPMPELNHTAGGTGGDK